MCEILNTLHEMPKKHGLSIEWIADHMGINPSTLQRQLNPHDSFPFPLKKLIPFMNACNSDFTPLDLIESRLGRTAYTTGNAGLKADYKAVAKLAKESGEAISTLATAIADENLDDDEKKTCTKELLDLQRVVNMLLVQLTSNG
tara:strand:- start:98 stop:529 length:432 start_codon:yes stop_codon:yes gene_type:complete